MHDPLAPLLADGVLDEVCGRLKSGKEADLWLVRHGGRVVAAKVYKAREARSFRNNAGYKEGRQVRDTRTQRAMARGSRFGQAAAEEAWKAKEADALHALHAAGVRVPAPVLFYEGVLLMELVLDAHGLPAPRLVDARVPRERAAALYADLRGQAVRMLACDLVHGDLSAYNVLLGAQGPVVIDFPQVVGAAHNSQAEAFFRRDLENLRRFFAVLDPALHACAGDAQEIWRAYVRRELHPEFVPSGRSEPPRPPRSAPPRSAAPRSGPPRTSGDGARDGGRLPARDGRGTPNHRGAAGRSAPPRGGGPRARPDSRDAQARPPAGAPRPQHRGRPPHPRPPEVVRVVRPSLGPAQAPPQVHAPSAPGEGPRPPAADGGPSGPPHTARRRRRRRRA